jgi:citrate synthase
LYGIADAEGVTGDNSRLAQAVEDELKRVKGKRVPMNQDGAIGALGLDMGFDWRLLRALAFMPRSAGLAVHAVEEMTRESGWRHVPDDEITYDGPPKRPFPGR